MRDTSPILFRMSILIYINEDMSPGESLMTVVATSQPWSVVRGTSERGFTLGQHVNHLAVLALLLEGFTLPLDPLDVIGGHLEI